MGSHGHAPAEEVVANAGQAAVEESVGRAIAMSSLGDQ